jgi:twinkle protein
MGKVVGREPCPKCGSRNNLVRYDNGSAHCYGAECDYRERATEGWQVVEETTEAADWTPIRGQALALTKRGIKEEICKLYRYEVGEFNGQPVQIANFYDENRVLVRQKLRTQDKKFISRGDAKAGLFFGQGLWQGGKYLTITEGEIDCLSVSQAFDGKYAVVSLPDGCDSAKRMVEKNYEWLDRFENIVLMFDMDKPGRAAAEQMAQMLPAGKALVASLPEKDANETLLKLGTAPIVKAFWNAAPWRPDGIVSGDEFALEDILADGQAGIDLPYPILNEKMLGLRKGELTLVTAGSGIGKSTLVRELAYMLRVKYGMKIGNVFLEEGNRKTAQAYVAIHNNVPLGKLRHNKALLTTEQWEAGLDTAVRGGGMWFYNHFGSLESKQLLSKLRYLATVCAVDFIVLDHISIATSGLESSSEGERKDIDILMTRLRSLVEETGVGIIAIVHLKRVNGKSFNEGAEVALTDLRGSASLEQLSDNVIALERNQQIA